MKLSFFRSLATALVVLAMSLSPVMMQASEASEVNVYSYRKPQLIDPMFEVFTEQTGIKVNSVFAKKACWSASRVREETALPIWCSQSTLAGFPTLRMLG